MSKLEINNIGGKRVITQLSSMFNEVKMCGKQNYIEGLDNSIVLSSYLDLDILYFVLNKSFQNIYYRIDIDWTPEQANEYLIALYSNLSKVDKDNLPNILDKERYKPRINLNFKKSFCCDAISNNRNNAININYKCDDCTEIELDDKCAYCPIGSGCPVCRSKKPGACYMHQAEAIACILYYNSIGEVYRGNIPYMWIKNNFGITMADLVEEKRDIDKTYHIVTNGQNNIRASIHVLKDNKNILNEIYNVLNILNLSYKEIDINKNIIRIHIKLDSEVLELLKSQIDIPINVTKLKIEYGDKDNYKNIPVCINDIIIGTDDGCSIIDTCSKSAGSPYNQFTHAVMNYMKDYIKPNQSVLDIGCGRGTIMVLADRYGATDITGIDISHECIMDTLDLIDKNVILNNHSNFKLIEDDIFNLINQSTIKYNLIIGNLAYSMQKEIIPKIHKILKDDGIYIAGGMCLLTEKKILSVIDQSELELVNIKYLYVVQAIILKKKRGK